MVRGIELFRNYFKDYTDKYILIGGTACDIAMDQMGLDFRATKDLDIVLIVETLDAQFGSLIWEFIKAGGYQNRQKSTGKALFYRFYKPNDDNFPYMLEFFARKPNALNLPQEGPITPIPIDQTVSSLSAILLDDDYYGFIVEGKTISEDISSISPEYLIPMKAKAYLDLSALKKAGEHVDSKDIKKHKNDVFRLSQTLAPEAKIEVPQAITEDLRHFLETVIQDPPILKNLGIVNSNLDDVISNLKHIYGIL